MNEEELSELAARVNVEIEASIQAALQLGQKLRELMEELTDDVFMVVVRSLRLTREEALELIDLSQKFDLTKRDRQRVIDLVMNQAERLLGMS